MCRYGLSVSVDGQHTSANTFKHHHHHHHGAGEMAQWIKCLSLKHEDISSNPQQPCRKSSMRSHACIPVAGSEAPGQSVSSSFSEREIKVGSNRERHLTWTSGLYTHSHPQTHTHTHTHTHTYTQTPCMLNK